MAAGMPISEPAQLRGAVTGPHAFVRIAAVVYIVIGAMLIVFLVALAGGVSWARLTANRVPGGTLTGTSRLSVLLTAVTQALFAGVVATGAGLVWPKYAGPTYPLLWIVGFYEGLSTVVQARRPNRWARRIWLPACLVLTACVAVVLIGLR